MKSTSLVVLATAIVLVSCNPKFYVPNTQNVPLIGEKGEGAVTVSGNGNQVEVQGAYGVSNAIALQLNGGAFIPADVDNGNGGSGKFVEVGGGYFKKLNEKVIFETYGIVGLGAFENHLPSTLAAYPMTNGELSASFIRLGIQPNIGYRSKNFAAAFSTRVSNVSYSNVKGKLFFDDLDQGTYLKANASNIFIEPSVTLRGGWERFKVQLQYVYSLNASNTDFPMDDQLLTLGLHVRFK